MNNDEPIAYFITWTVYGTFLQGDQRWWRKRGYGEQHPEPLLSDWHHRRLKYPVVLLDVASRAIVASAVQDHCDHRSWKLWAVNPRTNHVHAVVGAPGYTGKKVRDQLKANATRAMRESFCIFRGRPVWTVGGDWQFINHEDELAEAIEYANDAQDRKGIESNEPLWR